MNIPLKQFINLIFTKFVQIRTKFYINARLISLYCQKKRYNYQISTCSLSFILLPALHLRKLKSCVCHLFLSMYLYCFNVYFWSTICFSLFFVFRNIPIFYYHVLEVLNRWSIFKDDIVRRVSRYQRGNQNPHIEEQTTQWPKEKVQKDKQRSTRHI